MGKLITTTCNILILLCFISIGFIAVKAYGSSRTTGVVNALRSDAWNNSCYFWCSNDKVNYQTYTVAFNLVRLPTYVYCSYEMKSVSENRNLVMTAYIGNYEALSAKAVSMNIYNFQGVTWTNSNGAKTCNLNGTINFINRSVVHDVRNVGRSKVGDFTYESIATFSSY